MVKVKKEKEEVAVESVKGVRFASCSSLSDSHVLRRSSVLGYVSLAMVLLH